MTDRSGYALPEGVDERLDALLAGWAAASALPVERAVAIRCRVLAEGGRQQTELGVEWWQPFTAGLNRIVRRSTLALRYVLPTAAA
ncbi:MAG: hypothetical protein ACYC5O_13885 [Anaerolineae bacterium]